LTWGDGVGAVACLISAGVASLTGELHAARRPATPSVTITRPQESLMCDDARP
jgi:hypothetical protein